MPKSITVPIVQLRMVKETEVQYKTSITSADSIIEMMTDTFEGEYREKCYVIGFDSQHYPVCIHLLGVGGTGNCIVPPASIFKPILLSNASAFILMHNHPSGHLVPSDSDKKLTKAVKEGAQIFGLRFLDHLIVGPEVKKYHSFAEHGMI